VALEHTLSASKRTYVLRPALLLLTAHRHGVDDIGQLLGIGAGLLAGAASDSAGYGPKLSLVSLPPRL
jgi:hypothetical protein